MRATLQQQLIDRVDQIFEEQLHFLIRLISFPSITGAEGPCQLFLAEACRGMGLHTDLLEASRKAVKAHPGYIEINLPYENRPNVVARVPRTGHGRSLILNGHIDVVSPEPVSRWTADPWQGVIRDGHLFGRGASDMKGGLTAGLFAVKAILDCGLMPQGDVTLESVIEEELGGSGGTLACFHAGIRADAMIIPEPTRERLWISHPGIMYFRVKVIGCPVHAARSHEGVNAIGKMVPVIEALEALDEKRARTLTYPLLQKETGRACNLSLGTINGGDWVSTVAGWAVLEGRIGFTPGETREKVRGEVEAAIRDAVGEDVWFRSHPVEVEWFGWNAEPWLEHEDSPVVQTLGRVAAGVMGVAPEISSSSGGLDTRFGTMFGVPTVAFGPRGDGYHGIDEYVELESLRR